jgi:hypothetical protein
MAESFDEKQNPTLGGPALYRRLLARRDDASGIGAAR